MRHYFRQTDQFPTISIMVSAPSSLAGQAWRCVLPLAGMTFDQRTDQDAFISGVIAAAFGGDDLPAGVTCRLLADTAAADYASGFDARQTPLGAIVFELIFAADFAGMTDVPLIFTVAGMAIDVALDELTLPTLTTNTTDLTFKDFQGGTLPGGAYSAIIPPPNGFNLKGAWEIDEAYNKNDVVINDGASYVTTDGHTATSATEPGSGANWEDYWQLLAEKGDDGTDGQDGEPGPSGEKGDPGSGSTISVSDGTTITNNVETIVFGDATVLDNEDGSVTLTGFKGDQGDQGPAGEKGDRGIQGEPGPGIPLGGDTGQVLTKASGDDLDAEWVDPPEGGGGSVDIRDVWLFA